MRKSEINVIFWVVLLTSYVFVSPVFPSLGGGFCSWTMELRNAECRAKPPAPPGQWDERLTLYCSVDEDGVYGFFCQRSSEHSTEDEPDYASIDDDSSPSLGGSLPRRTWRHHPKFISLTDDCAGHRGDAKGKNKFFGSGEVLAFDELSQTKHRHVLEHGETDPVRMLELLWADLGRDNNIPRWEDVNSFSLSPGEMKTWPSQLVSVSVFQAYSQPESRHFRTAVTVGTHYLHP